MTAPQDKTLLPVNLCRRLRATGGGGQGGPLKVEAADLIEAQQATMAGLVEAAAAAISGNMLLQQPPGEYVAIPRSAYEKLTAALATARSSVGDVKP